MDTQYCDDSGMANKHNDQEIKADLNLFTRHNDSVLCCSIDNNARLAVSGGIDDTAFVWDLKTKHVIFECLGHKESIVAASFSLNSTYVATGDLNGYIQVRNTTTGIRVFDFEIDEINWILWHNTSDFVLLAGTAKGDFWMWNVNDPKAVKTFNSYGTSCTSAKLLPDGLKAIISYQDGSVRIFDLKTKQSILHFQNPAKSEVISLDLNATKSVLAIGCIDSSIRLLTVNGLRSIGELSCKTPDEIKLKASHNSGPSTSEPMDDESTAADEEADNDTHAKSDTIEVIDEYSIIRSDTSVNQELVEDDDDNDNGDDSSIDMDEEESVEDEKFGMDSVESVAFSPCGTFLAAANNSGTIMIWDVSTLTSRNVLHTGTGITRAAWTRDGQYIAGHLDGSVGIYDNNLNEKNRIAAHRDQILDLALKNNILVTASEDKTLRTINF